MVKPLRFALVYVACFALLFLVVFALIQFDLEPPSIVAALPPILAAYVEAILIKSKQMAPILSTDLPNEALRMSIVALCCQLAATMLVQSTTGLSVFGTLPIWGVLLVAFLLFVVNYCINLNALRFVLKPIKPSKTDSNA